jgi:hypothetical protein
VRLRPVRMQRRRTTRKRSKRRKLRWSRHQAGLEVEEGVRGRQGVSGVRKSHGNRDAYDRTES